MKYSDNPNPVADHPASPCIRHCCLNDDDICVGCFRTLEEIKRWQASSDQQKRKILNDCERRRQQAGHSHYRSW